MTQRNIHHRVGQGYRGGGPLLTLWVGPDLLDILPEIHVASRVPGGGVKLDQPPDSLCALPCAGHNCNPGGG